MQNNHIFVGTTRDDPCVFATHQIASSTPHSIYIRRGVANFYSCWRVFVVFLCEVRRWKIDIDCNILRTEWLLMPYRCSHHVLTLPVIYLILVVKGGWAEPIYMPELWWFKAIISFDSSLKQCKQKIVADWICVDLRIITVPGGARALLVLPVDQHTYQLW
jgi:hypothetical protein